LSGYLLLITFFINFKLAIIQIIVVLLTIPILKVGGEKLEKIGVEKKTVSAKLISTIIEYISGIEVFKSFGVIGDKFERLEKGFRDLKKYSIKLELAAVPYVLLFQIIIDLLFPILLLLAVRFFMNGELEAKMLVGFIVLSLTLTNVIRNFSASYSITRYLFLSVAKISDTLNYPVISYKDEDFKTNYKSLWNEISILFALPYCDINPAILLNPIRRIIETYVNFNGLEQSDFLSKVEGAKKFFDVNSHSIDDLEADLNGKSKENIIEIFKECFEKNNSIEHFKKFWKEENNK